MNFVLLLASLHCGADTESAPTIRAVADPTRIEVAAALPDKLRAQVPAGKLSQEQGERWLRFTLVDPDSGKDGPAILGAYERRQATLYFTPRYPLSHSQRYRATLEQSSNEYRVPARPLAAAAVIEKIYPTTDELPANQLKFYIHFSKPMRESKKIFDQMELLGPDGKPMPDPWRRTELWSADNKRLTLWIHPGRVKQGVNLRVELGPVLLPDKHYTLVIRPDLLDADGQPLGKAFTKKFHTIKEERTRPRLEDWKVQPPETGTTGPLIVKFPRPMDRALLDRFVSVVDDRERMVAGRIEVGAEEKSWLFHPRQPWQAESYRIVVDGQLEDLAGNTPLRLFDVDLDEPGAEPAKLTIAFQPAAGKNSK